MDGRTDRRTDGMQCLMQPPRKGCIIIRPADQLRKPDVTWVRQEWLHCRCTEETCTIQKDGSKSQNKLLIMTTIIIICYNNDTQNWDIITTIKIRIASITHYQLENNRLPSAYWHKIHNKPGSPLRNSQISRRHIAQRHDASIRDGVNILVKFTERCYGSISITWLHYVIRTFDVRQRVYNSHQHALHLHTGFSTLIIWPHANWITNNVSRTPFTATRWIAGLTDTRHWKYQIP